MPGSLVKKTKVRNEVSHLIQLKVSAVYESLRLNNYLQRAQSKSNFHEIG